MVRELPDASVGVTIAEVKSPKTILRFGLICARFENLCREVLVQGSPFFAVRTRACLNGSSFGGSCLKLGWVGVGLRMELHAEDQWIITSHVRSIAVEPSATHQPH